MALNDVYQITQNQVINGRECSNVFYYAETTASGTGTADISRGLCDRFWFNIWDAVWRLRVTTQCELTAVVCRRIWPTVEPFQVLPFANELGVVLGDSAPNGSCALLTFAAFIPTRPFMRRTYISGISQNDVFKSQLTVAFRTDLRALADRLADDVFSLPSDPFARFTPAAFSKKLAAASDPQPWQTLHQRTVKLNVRSQRRRNLSGTF